VEATNPGDTPVTLVNAAVLQVIPPSGEPFVAAGGLPGVTKFFGFRSDEITLAPKETRDLTFWSSMDSPLFVTDKRFHTTGRYGLQRIVDALRSNEVILTVIEPTRRACARHRSGPHARRRQSSAESSQTGSFRRAEHAQSRDKSNRHPEPRRRRRISAATAGATGGGRRILRSFAVFAALDDGRGLFGDPFTASEADSSRFKVVSKAWPDED
jgi:hypothetical protein